VQFLVPISMFMCIAAVMILRPLTKQLGAFLEAVTKERTQPSRAPQLASQDTDTARLLALMEHAVKRLDSMEDRLDFTERLVSSHQRGLPQLSVQNTADIGLREETLHRVAR
jgi:hypothetical protein